MRVCSLYRLHPPTFLSIIDSVQSKILSSRLLVVERPDKKPCWCLVMTLFLAKSVLFTMTRSINVRATQVREIGLYLDTLDADPVLYIGVTTECFQFCGTLPIDINDENSSDKGADKQLANVLNSLGGNAPGPLAPLILSFLMAA